MKPKHDQNFNRTCCFYKLLPSKCCLLDNLKRISQAKDLQSCSGEQSGHVNFWYTCDFQMESDMNAMSEECRKIYSQKASKSDVYELYKTEAEMFYKFRNKLVECESNGKICALSDNQNELEMPLVSEHRLTRGCVEG